MKRLRELPIGTTVGDNYRLLRRLGEGNIGTVYEARHRQGRRCALKLVTGVISDDREAIARFQRQADGAARLADPSLVRVFDFGITSSGTAYLVMELLEGEDLGHRFRRVGVHEPPVVSYIVRKVATALGLCHERGIVHGALKPANIFLVPVEGDVPAIKLLDCGTATVDDARTLQHDGMLEDTLPYVSPEQAHPGNDPIGPACDQWALACVAWQLLTGRPPFVEEDSTSLLYQITYEDPLPAAEEGPRPPPAVMKVLERALQKRADQRFPDLASFAGALEQVAGILAVAPRKRRQSKTRPTPSVPTAPAPPHPAAAAMAAAPAPAMSRLRQPLIARPPIPAAETSTGYPSPVFLPGMTPREATSPRRTAPGAQTRVQGLRVRTPDRAEGGSSETMPRALSSDLAARPRAGLGRLVTAARKRPWLLAAALPAVALIFLVTSWPASKPAVDVARVPAPSPGATPVGMNSAARPAGRPVIVPLTSPRPGRASLRESRRRGRGMRAKRAIATTKARRNEAGSKQRRGQPRRR